MKNSKNSKELEIVYEPVDKLKPSNYNPRTISEKDLKALVKNMNKYGTLEILVANQRTGNIISGHQRLKAALLLGMEELPVIWIDVSKRDEKMINLAMNKISGEWDAPMLKDILEEIDNGEGDMDMTGFDDVEIEMLMTESYQGETEEDEVPEPPDNPITKTGDLWLLGEHRVLCGDCTKEEDVKRLGMNGDIQVTLTDPPYSVGYENLKRKKDAPTRKQMGDDYKDPKDAFKLLSGFISNIPSDVLVMTYLFNKHFQELAESTKEYDLLYECVWVKHHFAFIMGRRYQPRHEPILIFRKKKGKGVWNVPTNQSTVFEYDKPSSNPDHPTPKPLGLWSELLSFHTNKNGGVYDPFLGSGTTLIAAEQLNRKVFGIEIEPRYVDVTIKRWENLTGKKAKLLK